MQIIHGSNANRDAVSYGYFAACTAYLKNSHAGVSSQVLRRQIKEI